MAHKTFVLRVIDSAHPPLSLGMAGLCSFHMFTPALLVRWPEAILSSRWDCDSSPGWVGADRAPGLAKSLI